MDQLATIIRDGSVDDLRELLNAGVSPNMIIETIPDLRQARGARSLYA